MVCTTAELEATRSRTCDPTRGEIQNSLGNIDQWGTTHFYLPFMVAIVNNNPWLGLVGAYFYESVAVLDYVYSSDPAAEYTGIVDGLIQDPGYGLVGAFAAYIISRGFRLHGGVPSFQAAADRWLSILLRRPLQLSEVQFFFVATAAVLACYGLNIPGDQYAWGSSNHLCGPFWLLLGLVVSSRSRESKATYATLALAGPCVVSNVASGVVFALCSESECRLGSTFLWSNLAVVLYACFVYAFLRRRPRRRIPVLGVVKCQY